MQIFKHDKARHTTTEIAISTSMTTQELLDLAISDGPNISIYMRELHPETQAYVYLDLSWLLSEVTTSIIPELVSDYNLLSDQLFDAYQVEHLPFGSSAIRTHDIKTIEGVSVYACNITNPDSREQLSLSPTGYKDIVLSPNGYDLSNCLVAIGGKIRKTVLFEKELYIYEGVKAYQNDPEMVIIDFDPVGGIERINLADLSYKVVADRNKVYFTLPADKSFSGDTGYAPILVINGRLHVFDEYYKVDTETIFSINLNMFTKYDFLEELMSGEVEITDIVTSISAQDKADIIASHLLSAIFLTKKPLSKNICRLENTAYEGVMTYNGDLNVASGICMFERENHILPYRILTSEFTYNFDYTRQVIYTDRLDKEWHTADTSIDPSKAVKLPEQYVRRPDSRIDYVMVAITSE